MARKTKLQVIGIPGRSRVPFVSKIKQLLKNKIYYAFEQRWSYATFEEGTKDMSLIKYPIETFPITADFVKRLPPGEVLTPSSQVTIEDVDGKDVTSLMLMGVPQIQSPLINLTIQGGVAGQTYRLRIIGRTGSYTLEDDISIIVSKWKLLL